LYLSLLVRLKCYPCERFELIRKIRVYARFIGSCRQGKNYNVS